MSEAGQFEVAIRLVQQMRSAGDTPSKVNIPVGGSPLKGFLRLWRGFNKKNESPHLRLIPSLALRFLAEGNLIG